MFRDRNSIEIKNPDQIALMRKAGLVVAEQALGALRTSRSEPDLSQSPILRAARAGPRAPKAGVPS